MSSITTKGMIVFLLFHIFIFYFVLLFHTLLDAVNVASRMESTGVAGRIQVSQETFERVQHLYIFDERGKVDIKGKGNMLVYLFKERKFELTSR